ncbi:hypothetical protein ACHQM5_019833 [Ranunculus cassubicifolius]
MASLLKEALNCLCGVNRWSYAIFWKIGCQNPSLLVWEDHHYEPTRNGGIDSSGDLMLREWQGLLSYENRFNQNGGQREDKIGLLLNNMMLNNHVHVVGEGIIGRTAFTDAHVWILQENIVHDHYPSEVLAEVHRQFSAGMQTVAAIPVLPHGVVQLGSTHTIVENMGFINDVKNLFAQLGRTPAILSSDYYNKVDPNQRTATPPLYGIPISADSFKGPRSQVAKFAPFISASRNQEMSASQASGFATQPSNSFVTQNQPYMQRNASVLRSSDLSSFMSKSATDFHQVMTHPGVNPHHTLNGQLGARTVGAQVILSTPDARSNPREILYQSNSKSTDQLVQSGSFNSLTFMEQQSGSSMGQQDPVNQGAPTSSNTSAAQLRSYGGRFPSYAKDSVIVSLLGGNQLPNARNDLQMLTSIPYSGGNSSNPSVEAHNFSSSDKSSSHLPNQVNLSNTNYALQGVGNQSDQPNLMSGMLSKGKQAIHCDLFQSLGIPSHQSDAHIPKSGPSPDHLQERSVSGLRPFKEDSSPQNVNPDNACVQPPSGDDLFDMLGLDYRDNQLHGSWNDFMLHGEDAKTKNSNVDASKHITQTESVREVNDGISESGIFSGTGSDHLLDAVVSKIQSSAKQSSDDDMSCWTTLTRMSNSSVHSDSPKAVRVNVPDQKQTKTIGFPSPHPKSQLSGSSSFITGCSVDKAAESSQINSMYGSQMSLLCEDGSTGKRDNSISTAHSKRPDETGKLNRKRLRPGENPRPRPKDRQMIQDRVKELREIVPNGAKCSIDALLERTIKHMLFLQSVTKHADKLKNTGESKIISKDGGLLLEDNFDGGATWAFEVGAQSMVCPIIVEDLSTPRQMLVEMLCEEQGFFLEIADIIRGLGLTILKGVMEARNDKVWVRFTVEANRDVTRMEIFLSLVHLLEQAMKSGASTSKEPDNNNMIAPPNTFHSASVPVNGRSVSLQ